MQRLMGQMRRAITDYNMIQDEDKIAIGVSGGKDSMALLAGLAGLRRFLGVEFTLVAITLDLCFSGVCGDYTAIADLCSACQVEYIVKKTDIGQIVFDVRKESHPCSLCARMRRGALHDIAKECGCNKIALGHHQDDAIETFFMNLFNEGRLGCFSPVSYLSRKDITMIRPLVYAQERDVVNAVRRAKLPVVKSVCPADGYTSRQKTKEFIAQMQEKDENFKSRVFGAMKRSGMDRW